MEEFASNKSADGQSEFICSSCGAKMHFAPGMSSLKCEFCGKITHLTPEYNKIVDLEDAELIVPFKTEEKLIELSIYEAMSSGEYTPDDMIERSRFISFKQYYVPFYLFSGEFTGSWTATFGYDRQESYTSWRTDSEGKKYPVTEHRTVTDWSPVNGQMQGVYKLLGYSGKMLNADAARLLENSDGIEDATEDKAAFMAGMEIESYQLTERDVFSSRIESRLNSIIERNVYQNAQGDRQRDWNWNATYEKNSTTLLMPICHTVFVYEDKEYNTWTDGTNINYSVSDPFPEDSNRKKDIWAGFLPLWISLGTAAAGMFLLLRHPETPFLVYLALLSVIGLSIAFGYYRKWALINYSKRLRASILNFHKASIAQSHLLSSDDLSNLASSFQKPERTWITNNNREFLWAPSMAILFATILIVLSPLLYNFKNSQNTQEEANNTTASQPRSPIDKPDAEIAQSHNQQDNRQNSANNSSPSNRESSGGSDGSTNQVLITTEDNSEVSSESQASKSAHINGSRELIKKIFNSVNSDGADLKQYYMDKVKYFGANKSKKLVINEKLGIIKRWPTRDYQVDDEGTSITCDGDVCNISAKVNWQVTKENEGVGRRGVATYNFKVEWTGDRAAVTAEDSSIISKEDFNISADAPSANGNAWDSNGNLTNSDQNSGQGNNQADQCDNLAGNPNDLRRNQGFEGAGFDVLRSQSEMAVSACAAAVRERPYEPRYRYQYARALTISNPEQAIPIFKQLTNERYLAAYDNLGNIFLLKQFLNYRQAAQYFIQGAQLGDPDSMMSLVRMIDGNYVSVPDPVGYRYALIRKAASLGNVRASQQLQEYNNTNYYGNYQNGWGNRQMEQQIINGVLGGLLGAFGR